MKLCYFINEAFKKDLGVFYQLNQCSYVIFKDVSYKIHLINKKINYMIMPTKSEDKSIRRFINENIINDEGIFYTCDIINGKFILK